MSVSEVIGTLGTLSSVGVGAVLVWSRKQVAALRQDVADLHGRPARYGAAGGLIAPAVPGAMELLAEHGRILAQQGEAFAAQGEVLAQHGALLAVVSAELQTNGGKSVKDVQIKQGVAISEMRSMLATLMADRSEVKQ